jgi:hypothetical protein
VIPDHVSPVDLKHKVRRVYAANLPRLPLSQLKQHMFNLRFSLSKIMNISYVGRSIVEFTILEEYEYSFLASLRRCELHVIHAYDPSKVQDKNSNEDLTEVVRGNFIARLKRISIDSTRDLVRAYFADWHASEVPVVGSGEDVGSERDRDMDMDMDVSFGDASSSSDERDMDVPLVDGPSDSEMDIVDSPSSLSC